MSFIQTTLLVLAVSAVAIADIFLKKTQIEGSLLKAITSPWMLCAIVLYLFQIFFFTYLFASGAKLINIGIMQTVLYAVIILVAGIYFFEETLSSMQIAGVILALLGVLLLNF
jgi:drug/metabolite transporter (DMT)-like permease